MCYQHFNFYVAHPFLPSMEFVPSVPMAQPIVVGLAWRKRGRRREANQGGAGRRLEKFSRNEAATRFELDEKQSQNGAN